MNYNRIIIGKKTDEFNHLASDFEGKENFDFLLSDANWIALNREVGIGKHICDYIKNNSPELLENQLDTLLSKLKPLLNQRGSSLEESIVFYVHPGITNCGDERLVNTWKLIEGKGKHEIAFYSSAAESGCEAMLELYNDIYHIGKNNEIE